MRNLPIDPISPEEQQRVMRQMYVLMGKQVQSYHKHRHMGNHSSVPAELAQELMESVVYTVNQAGGLYTHGSIEEALQLGQEILERRYSEAKSLLELVSATAPKWQTECRWEALRYLRQYLQHYDHLHLAHQGPEGLYYPILIDPPEGIQGIDSCIFSLNVLWIENQIMAGVPETALEPFWDRLPAATANQCEHLLINGMGKAMLDAGLDPLIMQPGEHMQLLDVWMGATEESLKAAAARLCGWLAVRDEAAGRYVEAVIPQLLLWKCGDVPCENLDNMFVW